LLAHPTSRDELIPVMANVAQRAQQLLLESQLERPSNVLELTPSSFRKLSDAG
jgi:hypothetical protein